MSSKDLGSPEDFFEIERLLHRYAVTIDDRDLEGFLECWAPGTQTREGVAEGIAFHSKFEYTVHAVLNHSYTIKGATATGMQYSRVTYVENTGGKLTQFEVFARYENDQLVKQDGRWVFLKRKWTPIFSAVDIPVVRDVPPGFWDMPR